MVIFPKSLSKFVDHDTENASVSHSQTGEDAQNERKVKSAKIFIPCTVQFRRILCLVSSFTNLTDCRNWPLTKTIKHSYPSRQREREGVTSANRRGRAK